MVELVSLLQWNYISIIYEESNYGIKVNLFIHIPIRTFQLKVKLCDHYGYFTFIQ